MSIFSFHIKSALNKPGKHSVIITSAMKKILNKNLILSALLAFTLLSCDKIPDGIVDVSRVDYKILGVSAPIGFTYSPNDSAVVTSIQISNYETVSDVWCKVTSVDGTLLIKDQIPMYDNGNVAFNGDQTKGDGIYTAKFVMGKLNPNGNYQIEYFIEDNIRQAPENLVKAGVHIFTFNNGQNNLPPVISNLLLPSSVNRGDSFIFSIKVDDANGSFDISQVYFKLYRPNGSIVLNGNDDFFLMVDNGDTNLGDQTAGDGIYSFKNSFGSTAPTGLWKFDFQAKDRSGKLSNIISSNMMVN